MEILLGMLLPGLEWFVVGYVAGRMDAASMNAASDDGNTEAAPANDDSCGDWGCVG